MKTVAARFKEIEQLVMLPMGDISAIQRQEMRRMFYAGFFSALKAAAEISQECDDDDDALVDEMLQKLHDECRRFGEDVRAGRA
jgi:hypothetical protein